MSVKNLIVGQSGGPTAVINGSLYGVITEAFKHPDQIGHVYGMVNGIEGFLKGTIMDMDKDITKEEVELIRTTPGAFLGSCRYKLPASLDDEVYAKMFAKFEEMNIGYFLYIGGNDSMDTVSKLARYADAHNSDIRVIGLPKTVDNDLVQTDHTPGFASAAKYVATTVREITTDAEVYDAKSVTIVEIMGRHAGWLTAASVLARRFEGDNPLLIYLPEVAFVQDDFLKQLEAALEKHHNIIVCISEGIHDADGTFICEYDSNVGVDNFGHKMLAGSGKYLENLVKNKLGVKVRSVELNVSQRCSANLASLTDQTEAVESGAFGVKAALEGKTMLMVAFNRVSDDPYKIECALVNVNEVCDEEKKVPLDWITKDGTDVSNEFIKYALPLIQGKVDVPTENGLPRFAYRK